MFRYSSSGDRSWASSAAVSALFGCAAGAVGTLLAVAFIVPASSFAPVSSPAPRPRIGTEGSVSAAGVESAARALAHLTETRAQPLSPLSAYVPGDALGLGLALTSDGWILTSEAAFAAVKRPTVVVGGRAVAVEKIVRDPYTGAVLAKVAASDLSVTSFGEASSLEAGDAAFVMDAAAGISRFTVAGVDVRPAQNSAGAVRSSERVQRVLRLSGGVAMPGAMVLDARGEVVAIVAENGPLGAIAVPMEDISAVIGEALKNGKVSRPMLGVGYIDLAHVAAGTVARRGAYLASVVPGGPAARAGLRIGDVIVSVNAEPVSAKNGLADLVADYLPGDRLSLVVMRGVSSVEVGIVATLGETKTP